MMHSLWEEDRCPSFHTGTLRSACRVPSARTIEPRAPAAVITLLRVGVPTWRTACAASSSSWSSDSGCGAGRR